MSRIGQLIMDLVLFVVFGFIGMALGRFTGEAEVLMGLCFVTFGFVPFGWRWASTIITAVSPYGIFIKAAISLLLGIVAGPITLGKDIIMVAFAIKNHV